MKKNVKLMAMVINIFIFFSAAAALAEDFSADMISTTKGKVFKGRMFISKDKTRMETQESITITRMDKNLVWILMPKDKMYMEQAFDPTKAAATSEKVNGEIERKLVGQEKIDGKTAKKYQVVYSQGKKKETMFQWIVPGVQMPVKTAAVDDSWSMEYKNIKKGRQPDALFEVPSDYQKFSAMPSIKDIFKGFGR
jgi:hypothetical protein